MYFRFTQSIDWQASLCFEHWLTKKGRNKEAEENNKGTLTDHTISELNFYLYYYHAKNSAGQHDNQRE